MEFNLVKAVKMFTSEFLLCSPLAGYCNVLENKDGKGFHFYNPWSFFILQMYLQVNILAKNDFYRDVQDMSSEKLCKYENGSERLVVEKKKSAFEYSCEIQVILNDLA